VDVLGLKGEELGGGLGDEPAAQAAIEGHGMGGGRGGEEPSWSLDLGSLAERARQEPDSPVYNKDLTVAEARAAVSS
jgi:hypothetical protein